MLLHVFWFQCNLIRLILERECASKWCGFEEILFKKKKILCCGFTSPSSLMLLLKIVENLMRYDDIYMLCLLSLFHFLPGFLCLSMRLNAVFENSGHRRFWRLCRFSTCHRLHSFLFSPQKSSYTIIFTSSCRAPYYLFYSIQTGLSGKELELSAILDLPFWIN